MTMKLIAKIPGLETYVCTMDDIVNIARKSVYKKQRAHEVRVHTAKHTHGPLKGNKRVFSAGKLGRKVELVDGYTRAEAYQIRLAHATEEVILHVHVCRTQEELDGLYDQYDNAKAVKRGKDRVAEGLRAEGVDVRLIQSALVAKGPLPTAVVSGSGGDTNVRRATMSLHKGIMRLDTLGFSQGSGTVTGGVLAAFVAICQHVQQKAVVHDYLDGVHRSTFIALHKGDEQIEYMRAIVVNRRRDKMCSGTKNVDAMRDLTLTYFHRFVQMRKGVKAETLQDVYLTLGSFIHLYGKKAA